MSDRPILRDDPTEAEKWLLGSARLDVPSSSTRRHALAALGLAAATTTAVGAGRASTAAIAPRLARWLTFGALGGALALGAFQGWSPSAHRGVVRPTPGAVTVPSPVEVPASSPRSLPSPAPAASQSHQRPLDGDVPTGRFIPVAAPRALLPDGIHAASGGTTTPTLRAVTTPPRDAAPSQGATSKASLAEEISALDEARQALASAGALVSLGMLDDYDRRFTRPKLGPEASLLRIEALLAMGQVDLARQLGERLLTDPSSSAYAHRIRSLLAQGAGTNR